MLDFGAGFYTTSNRQQAVKWVKTQAIRRRKGKPIVSMYDFDEEKLDGISVCRFESADKEWLNFVADNRKGKYVGEKYDLVIGEYRFHRQEGEFCDARVLPSLLRRCRSLQVPSPRPKIWGETVSFALFLLKKN